MTNEFSHQAPELQSTELQSTELQSTELQLLRCVTANGAAPHDLPPNTPSVANQLYDFFEQFGDGNDWFGLGSQGASMHRKIRQAAGVPDSNVAAYAEEFYVSELINAIASEAYRRGIRNAAKYLGVDWVHLCNGTYEHIDGPRKSLTGIEIPAIRSY